MRWMCASWSPFYTTSAQSGSKRQVSRRVFSLKIAWARHELTDSNYLFQSVSPTRTPFSDSRSSPAGTTCPSNCLEILPTARMEKEALRVTTRCLMEYCMSPTTMPSTRSATAWRRSSACCSRCIWVGNKVGSCSGVSVLASPVLVGCGYLCDR